jgi:hypothetical protein
MCTFYELLVNSAESFKLLISITLKGQYHEIFEPRFFHQSNLSRSLIIILKYFRIWIQFRRDVHEYVSAPSYAP